MTQFARYLISLVIILMAFNSNAKVFRNAYISFDLPDKWKCALEQTEWICRIDPDKFAKETKEAIIVLAAKEVGPSDSMPEYKKHLDNPIQMIGKGGANTFSKVQYPSKMTSINNQEWIEGLHLSSEVNNYFTRYTATIKDRIAVLVTFSAHQMYYAKYSNDFFNAIKSMQVIAGKNLLSSPDNGVRPSTNTLFNTPSGPANYDPIAEEPVPENTGSSKKFYLLFAVIIAAIGGYIFVKSKKS